MAAFLLGRSIKRVSIVPDRDTLGHIEKTPLPDWLRPDIDGGWRAERWLRREIVVSMAGPTAERLLTGRASGVRGDFARIVDLSGYLAGDSKAEEAYLRWLWLYTEAMLRQPGAQAAVWALAEALLRQPTMSGRKARVIIREAIAVGAKARIKGKSDE